MSKIKKKTIKISESEYKDLLEYKTENNVFANENIILKNENQELKLTIKDLQRMIFGSKTEKTPKNEKVDFNQLALFEENNPDSTVEIKNEIPDLKQVKEKILRKRKKRGRRIVSDNLPVKEEIIYLAEEKKIDEFGNPLTFLGYVDKKSLHIIPTQIYCLLTRREIWGHGDSREVVVIAGRPDCIVPKGKYTDETICHFIYEKFYQSLPYHRQIASLNAAGGDFSKSTVSDATCHFAKLLEPVAKAVKDQIYQSDYIHADETPLKHGNFKKKMKQQFITVVQDRHQAYFHYGPRTQEELKNVLKEFDESQKAYMGYLMCDGLSGYNIHEGKRLACWAHARRKFFKLADTNKDSQKILDLINSLYKNENLVYEKANEESWPDDIVFEKLSKIRARRSVSVLDIIKTELDMMIRQYTPSSAMGKAIKYTLNNWEALSLYCEHGYLPIDNNAAERTLRTIVLGRKNWLFAGSKAAGSWAAVCYTIMESCKLLKIDPRKYLKLILKPLLINRDNPDFDYSSLTPIKMAPHIRMLNPVSDIS